jgi:hypothetical protein
MQTLTQRANAKDDKVSRIIERVLTQVFGKEATRLIYKHLEREYSVKRNEVGEKLELFAKGLEDFLKSGAYAVERRILEDTWSTYGLVRKQQLEKPASRVGFVSEMKFIMREA